MDGHSDQSDNVKRVMLPSGKTIEVDYNEDLHVCLECSSHLVQPVEWRESGSENWNGLLHCPNCHGYREGIFSRQRVEAFDEELERGADSLTRDYKRLMRGNMADEIERFVRALNADAILPEDF
jgi:hypothetical protein